MSERKHKTRLEIISDVVSEKARSGKIPIPHRFFPMWYRKKPMWYRYFRCGIGIFPLRAFPIPHRKLFLTVKEEEENYARLCFLVEF